MKSNSFLRRRGRRDQLFDRGKDGSEFFVIFLLQTLDLACEIGVAVHQTAKLHECSHDRDVDLDGTIAAQHAGKHSNALFGERRKEDSVDRRGRVLRSQIVISKGRWCERSSLLTSQSVISSTRIPSQKGET